VQLPRCFSRLTPRHFEPGDVALDMVADIWLAARTRGCSSGS
jgi:hypothetical protein